MISTLDFFFGEELYGWILYYQTINVAATGAAHIISAADAARLSLFCLEDVCVVFPSGNAREPGLSSQVLSPQSNPGASPGWRIGE